MVVGGEGGGWGEERERWCGGGDGVVGSCGVGGGREGNQTPLKEIQAR